MNYLQFDLEDPYPILLFGTAALASLWFASAIAGSIDSIPIVCVINFSIGSWNCWSCENGLYSYN